MITKYSSVEPFPGPVAMVFERGLIVIFFIVWLALAHAERYNCKNRHSNNKQDDFKSKISPMM